jgi:hypothetical protein
MRTAKSAGQPHSGARPERLVSDRIPYPSATGPEDARNGRGPTPGSTMIQLGSALGWARFAPRSAPGWTPSLAPWDKCPICLLESRQVPDAPAPSLRIRFQSAFPRAHMFAGLVPLTVGLAPVAVGLAPVVGGLVPFWAAPGWGDVVAPLTGGLACRT